MKAPFQRDGRLQGLTWPLSKRDVHPHVEHLVPPVCPYPLTPSLRPYPCPPYRLPPRAFRRRPRSLVPGHRRRRRAACSGGGGGRGGAALGLSMRYIRPGNSSGSYEQYCTREGGGRGERDGAEGRGRMRGAGQGGVLRRVAGVRHGKSGRLGRVPAARTWPCAKASFSRRMGNLTSQDPTMFWILNSVNLACHQPRLAQVPRSASRAISSSAPATGTTRRRSDQVAGFKSRLACLPTNGDASKEFFTVCNRAVICFQQT